MPNHILFLVLFLAVFQLNAQRHPRLKYYQNIDAVNVTERRPDDQNDFADYSSSYKFHATRPSLGISWDLRNASFTNEIVVSFSKNAAIGHSYVNRFAEQPIEVKVTKTFLPSVMIFPKCLATEISR